MHPTTHDTSLGIVKCLHVRISKLDHLVDPLISMSSISSLRYKALTDGDTRKAHKKPHIHTHLVTEYKLGKSNFLFSIIMESEQRFLHQLRLHRIDPLPCQISKSWAVKRWSMDRFLLLVKIVFHQAFRQGSREAASSIVDNEHFSISDDENSP